ncbi:uncharacterized protein G2W53_027205 [Senna tora]|uniref:Uncharacterized protein n=1 Tax=Senna tora TaxID=362788 RepID=A0A834WFU6_9FABA|nr:uncharacterized protein G2W53_027205 [Senna tora]
MTEDVFHSSLIPPQSDHFSLGPPVSNLATSDLRFLVVNPRACDTASPFSPELFKVEEKWDRTLAHGTYKYREIGSPCRSPEVVAITQLNAMNSSPIALEFQSFASNKLYISLPLTMQLFLLAFHFLISLVDLVVKVTKGAFALLLLHSPTSKDKTAPPTFPILGLARLNLLGSTFLAPLILCALNFDLSGRIHIPLCIHWYPWVEIEIHRISSAWSILVPIPGVQTSNIRCSSIWLEPKSPSPRNEVGIFDLQICLPENWIRVYRAAILSTQEEDLR